MARHIGRYEVLAELGRGGFGHVYRCLDPSLGTQVAVKTLIADGDAGMLVRFRNEAATSRRLRHPNIVTIYDVGDQDGVPYIVMELLEGEDLHRVIETRAPLSLLLKVRIMSQIASGLGHAHNHGIIHRDVKPANVMLLQDGSVKIMDFGIALITQSTHSRLTPRGAMIGTFRYMAPEQFRGGEPDARSDIFAYGLIFYELLSGVHPFKATESAALMYNILSVEPVPIGELRPDCPPELGSIVARLLHKDADLRYQSLDDALFDIEPVLLKLRESRSVELVNAARLAKSQNQLEKAQGLMREALALTPASEEARELREQLQVELRRQAVRPRIEDLVKRAHEAMAAGDPSQAAERFQSAIRLDPLDPSLRALLAEARSVAERLREAMQLLGDAKGALAGGDAGFAAQLARKALDLVPSLADAQEILKRAEAGLAEEKRKSRFAEELARARRWIEVHSWNEALELLAELDREFPDNSEVRILTEKLQVGLKKEEDERLLAMGLAAARASFRDGELSAALAGLEALSVQFPESADVGSMLNAVRLEIEAKHRRDLVNRGIEEARNLAARQEFEAAIKVLDGALAQYPTDPDLQREWRSIAAASRETARRTAIERAIAQAGELRSQARFAEAMQLLDSFVSLQGPAAAIIDLRKFIVIEEEAARRAAELRDFVRRANDLIAKGELETATLLLETSPAHVRENSEINRLRDAAELQKRLRAEKLAGLEALASEVQPLCDRGRFDEALQSVDNFENRHGPDPRADEIRNRIRVDLQKAQRSAEELRVQATALIASDPIRATVLLAGAPDHLRGRPEIRNLEEAAQRAIAEKRIREGIAELIARAKDLQAQGRFAEALNVLEPGLKTYSEHAELADFHAAMLAEQAKQQREHSLRVAVSKVRELISAQQFENAERALREALADAPNNPAILELRAELEERQQEWRAEQTELEIRHDLSKIRELLPAEPGPAARLIEALSRKYPGREDIEIAVHQVREAATEMHRRQLLGEVERLCEREEFEAALVRLKAVESDVAGEAALLRDRVYSLQEQSEGRRAAEAIQAAASFRKHDPQKALKHLNGLTERIRSRPEVQTTIQECQNTIEAAEARAALAEIENLLARGRLAKARNRHRAAVGRFGSNAGFEEVLARIEAAARESHTSGVPSKSPRQIRLILVAGFALVAGIAGAWILFHRSRSEPPVIALMPVEIRTDPDGVSVSIGDRSCLTPSCRFDLPAGEYQVRAERAGYEPAQHALVVERGKPLEVVSFTLRPIHISTPAGLPTGTLIVRTGTPDVLVFIDNLPAGRTDPSGNFTSFLETTAHNIRVQKSGYDSPPEKRVTVVENRSVPIAFTLTQQAATLELRGAPSGVELWAGATLLGRTQGSKAFTSIVPPGTRALRISEGSDSREINLTFDPGRTVTLDWPAVAPIKTSVAALPSKVDLAEQEWEAARAATDPAPVQAFIDKYPNGPHRGEAQSRLEGLVWSRTGQSDAAVLRAYLNQFPNGAHVPDAKSRLDELAWNGVDKTDIQALRAYLGQNSGNPRRSDAQSLIDQLENKRAETDRQAQEQAKVAVLKQQQVKGIRAALDAFNAAFEHKQPRELRQVWPTATNQYLDAMNQPGATFSITLRPTADPLVQGDTASVVCELATKTTLRGQHSQSQKTVKAMLRNAGDRWLIVNPFAQN